MEEQKLQKFSHTKHTSQPVKITEKDNTKHALEKLKS